MENEPVIEIDMVSDLVCPWCWIGLRNLMWAMHAHPDQKFSLTFRPYFLDGNLPKNGVEYQSYMEKKFPDHAARAAAITALTSSGKNVGIEFHFDKITRRPNTQNAHRLVLWAQEQGKGLQAKEALFHAFFTDGKDIGDDAVLLELAQKIEMDTALIQKSLQSAQDKDRILGEVKAFGEMGISSVPTFIIDRARGISGALPPDDLSKFIFENKTA